MPLLMRVSEAGAAGGPAASGQEGSIRTRGREHGNGIKKGAVIMGTALDKGDVTAERSTFDFLRLWPWRRLYLLAALSAALRPYGHGRLGSLPYLLGHVSLPSLP